jgi:adenosylhomocysteine nucleosidase
MPSEPRASARGTARIALVAALEAECESLHRAVARGAPWLVVQSGPGEARAVVAAERALAAGAIGLISWGLAGGIDVTVAPGTIVVPRRVLREHGAAYAVTPEWHERLAARAGTLGMSAGDLLTVAAALHSPREKQAAHAATGAVAVDMESAAIAAVAARAGVPFAVARVVVDGAADALPRNAEGWVDERGARRLSPVLRAVVTPSEWSVLATLGRRFAVARRALERFAEALAAERALPTPSRGAEA